MTASSRPALAGDLTFTLINKTDQPIVRLWTSPATASTWFEAKNIYVPKNGSSEKITFNRDAQGADCYQDIKFAFEGGLTREIHHTDLCTTSTITIDVSDSGTVTYKLDDHRNTLLVLVIIGLLLAIYFLPTTVASKRKIAMGVSTMFWINLFIGWTGIGWLFLILLAACAKTKAEDSYYQTLANDRSG